MPVLYPLEVVSIRLHESQLLDSKVSTQERWNHQDETAEAVEETETLKETIGEKAAVSGISKPQLFISHFGKQKGTNCVNLASRG